MKTTIIGFSVFVFLIIGLAGFQNYEDDDTVPLFEMGLVALLAFTAVEVALIKTNTFEKEEGFLGFLIYNFIAFVIVCIVVFCTWGFVTWFANETVVIITGITLAIISFIIGVKYLIYKRWVK